MTSAGANLSRPIVLTTALSERVADAIVLVTISAGGLLTTSATQPGWLANAARPFAILGLCGEAAIAFVTLFSRLWHGILARNTRTERDKLRVASGKWGRLTANDCAQKLRPSPTSPRSHWNGVPRC